MCACERPPNERLRILQRVEFRITSIERVAFHGTRRKLCSCRASSTIKRQWKWRQQMRTRMSAQHFLRLSTTMNAIRHYHFSLWSEMAKLWAMHWQSIGRNGLLLCHLAIINECCDFIISVVLFERAHTSRVGMNVRPNDVDRHAQKNRIKMQSNKFLFCRGVFEMHSNVRRHRCRESNEKALRHSLELHTHIRSDWSRVVVATKWRSRHRS